MCLFLASREYTVAGIGISPFSSGSALWYFVAAVSVFAAVVGLFGMVSALSANRRMVKTFEAFYVLSLMTQFALVAWLVIYFKSRQSDFDSVCNASKDGLFSMPLVPSFASDWSCQKLFMAAVLTMGIGGLIWIAVNVSSWFFNLLFLPCRDGLFLFRQKSTHLMSM